MIILDENFTESQRQLLRAWRIRVRQIGVDVGRAGMKDDEIPALLTSLDHPTLFTKDLGFYRRDDCHQRYCIVCLEVGDSETATFVRKVLKHRAFAAAASRMGKIVRVTQGGIAVRSINASNELLQEWET